MYETLEETHKGHVVIAPSPTLYDYASLLSNVEEDEFDLFMNHTYTQTVQRISHIRSLYGTEREFDRYYMRLKNKVSCEMNVRLDKELIKYQIHQATKIR